MLDKLGVAGLLGFLLLLGGIALLAYIDLLIAAGVAFVVAGLGLVIYGLVSGFLGSLGMGQMM
ncbi:hypothetical protein ACFR9U_03710 [Halorientalis brevis]|uniref:Major facilitator superfamily (MFS) profile domain-containing protein n=1 Tax=Halorientalis brevis TaxID=1126241 RepID=A0ABD6C6Z8_9EURY|nr:hypothetical protein [Halorientalis brevis]